MTQRSIWSAGLERVAETPRLHGGVASKALRDLERVAATYFVATEMEFRLWLCLILGWHFERQKTSLDQAVVAARKCKGLDPEGEWRNSAGIAHILSWFVAEISPSVRTANQLPVFLANDVIDALQSIATNKPAGGYQKNDPVITSERFTVIRVGYSPTPNEPT